MGDSNERFTRVSARSSREKYLNTVESKGKFVPGYVMNAYGGAEV